MKHANPYTGAGLDRLAHRRGDEGWLARRLSDPKARFLPVWQGRSLVRHDPDPRVLWTDAGTAGRLISEQTVVVFLGRDPVATYFAMDLSYLDQESAGAAVRMDGAFVELGSIGALLERREAARLAYARGILLWHERHRHCGVCGHRTVVEQGGHARRCTSPPCAVRHFPRTDPAVIMLVEDGARCVLGRQASWPAGLYSTLAGFVEPGESLEEAVAREVWEEVGLEVHSVRYQSSQPWPFPSSLMLGFRARADARPLTVARDELEDAGWFHRAEVAALQDDGPVRLPRRDSIARRLIEDWLDEES